MAEAEIGVLADESVERRGFARLRQGQHLQLDGIGLHRNPLELRGIGIERIVRSDPPGDDVRRHGDRVELNTTRTLGDQDLAEDVDLRLRPLDLLATAPDAGRDAVNERLLGAGGRRGHFLDEEIVRLEDRHAEADVPPGGRDDPPCGHDDRLAHVAFPLGDREFHGHAVRRARLGDRHIDRIGRIRLAVHDHLDAGQAHRADLPGRDRVVRGVADHHLVVELLIGCAVAGRPRVERSQWRDVDLARLAPTFHHDRVLEDITRIDVGLRIHHGIHANPAPATRRGRLGKKNDQNDVYQEVLHC